MQVMDTVYDLTASQWLSLTDRAAAALFPSPAGARQALYRKLVQRWHPDRNREPRAAEVFMRIQSLQPTLLPKSRPVPSVDLPDHRGRVFRYQPLASEPFVLGRYHRAGSSLAYQVGPRHDGLFNRARDLLSGLPFATPAMRASLSPLLPSVVGAPWGEQGGLLVIRHPKDAIRLRDLHAHAGHLDPRHVAWILSGLFNLACYLEHAKIVHHDISLDTVWVRPDVHEVLLLGGWFFAYPVGEAITALPAHAAALASPRYLSARKASHGLPIELIRAVGRELLGDRSGQRLPTTLPAPLRAFLTDPAGANAVDDYKAWKRALEASFGPPTFVPMPFSASEIYKETTHG